MWPFKKKPKATKQTMPLDQFSHSQLDITEAFGDNFRLKPEDWIATIPLNTTTPDGQASGLPSVDSSDEAVYAIASRLSQI
jgi:hypothetical protein